MNFIKECQVNTVGKSNGLDIPSGFRVGLSSIRKEIQEDDTVNVIFDVGTYKDDTHSRRIVNDDVNWSAVYNMTKSAAFTATDLTLFNNTLKADIITAYGSSNVVVV